MFRFRYLQQQLIVPALLSTSFMDANRFIAKKSPRKSNKVETQGKAQESKAETNTGPIIPLVKSSSGSSAVSPFDYIRSVFDNDPFFAGPRSGAFGSSRGFFDDDFFRFPTLSSMHSMEMTPPKAGTSDVKGKWKIVTSRVSQIGNENPKWRGFQAEGEFQPSGEPVVMSQKLLSSEDNEKHGKEKQKTRARITKGNKTKGKKK